MAVAALLPLKDLVQAKSRLAGLLTPSERRALAQAMAEDVLRVLAAHERVERTLLLSDDPAAGMLAKAYGATCWSEQALGVRGLNAVLAGASNKLIDEGQSAILVLHADLPLLSAADLDVVLAADALASGVVVAPDRHGRGTNLLAFHAERAPGFYFGSDSRQRHIAAAVRQGVPVMEVERGGTGLDIDEPVDLALLLQQRESALGPNVRAVLHGSGLAQRLQAPLASLAMQPAGLADNKINRVE